MPGFSLEDFDTHIDNLRSQLAFLNETLDATDHNAPDWLATDLIALRNKSGRLQDDMQRFRDQLEGEGLTSKKRLSLEGTKPSESTLKSTPPATQNAQTAPFVNLSPRPASIPNRARYEYPAQHIDVTEEVNRRLKESRLRRLMESPSTSQKRKYNAIDERRKDSTGDGEDGNPDMDRSPTKKLKWSGIVEPLKRKEAGLSQEAAEGRDGGGAGYKKRKM
ncbi:hypothetical protein BDV95DRAFT_586547 [Massariosphaeria phaeospora]|uniref:Uncharacterized protein n=1 Tax=Massariosphaeria phaeospora TaxID=100035 RepID=A0A7C8I5A1_9PLEO|nr:hypothetical protein BDV95DRAFT_586547 [Massariosphaeria phaeospora]